MGYTHGTKWTESEIKERIMEVVINTGIERMPSRNEIVDYYKDNQLAGAISKRKGFTKYAQELGLPVKESETYFGKKQEQIAMEHLISRGYEVRRMSQNFPYDLLINDCLKVDVKASRLYMGQQGNFYTANLEKPYCTCDIYIIYLLKDDRSTRDILIIPSKFISTNTQISIGEKKSKYYIFLNRWDYIEDYWQFLDKIS